MKIIEITNGCEIIQDIYNECCNEYVFGLDEHNNMIQNLTFQTIIHFKDKSDFDKIIKTCIEKNNIIIMETGFLFYSFAYQVSYAHFMTQTVPKLTKYIKEHSDKPLLIPEKFYNNLCKDVLKLLNLNNILILKDKIIYDIKNLIIIEHYPTPSDYYTFDHLFIYSQLRTSLCIKNDTNNKNRLVYLKRDGFANADNGNSETGLLRKVINEDELITELIKQGFEIITMGDKKLYEKAELLKSIKILIMPLGAVCLNLIFSNSPQNVIILSNENNFGDNYYIKLCETLNNIKINSLILKYKNEYNIDNKNRWNSSYKVDIDNIKSIIRTM